MGTKGSMRIRIMMRMRTSFQMMTRSKMMMKVKMMKDATRLKMKVRKGWLWTRVIHLMTRQLPLGLRTVKKITHQILRSIFYCAFVTLLLLRITTAVSRARRCWCISVPCAG
ncbi:hypothetical protein FOWG_16784 [Fusarium oxysporum f. sp. lycopersici MN25]|nr:hypothetical protein FOWG_16784 [Fusarium oxysporum f. sp. lycopersici MN25]